jgi:hypothetical protein
MFVAEPQFGGMQTKSTHSFHQHSALSATAVCLSSSSPSMDRTLAPELIDVIIDHLHKDARALKACSLVCKAWTQTARYHLFDRALVLDEYRWTMHKGLLQSNSIVPLIRDIWLAGNSSVRNAQFWNDLPFSILSAQFHKLETLRLHRIPWYQISSQARSSLLAPFCAVHVTKVHLSGITDLFISYIVSSLPSLVYLIGDILILSWTVNLEPVTFRHRIPATLRVIRLRTQDLPGSHSRIHAVLDRFLISDNLRSIHTVALRGVKVVDIQSINLFVAALGPALQTFMCDSQGMLPFSVLLFLMVVLTPIQQNFLP